MFDWLYSVIMLVAFNAIFIMGYIGNGTAFKAPLGEDEERKYILRLEKGDVEAKNALIEHNLRLVAHIARKYCVSYPKDGEDLISIGTLGLIKAVSNFKSEKGKLSTYAAKCIENEILMFLRSQKKLQNEVYLSDFIGGDNKGNDITLLDVLQSDEDLLFDKVSLKSQITKLYDKMKNVLKRREKQILIWRYGLLDTIPKTQHEIAAILNISRSYVSRIEKKALEKLRSGGDIDNF